MEEGIGDCHLAICETLRNSCCPALTITPENHLENLAWEILLGDDSGGGVGEVLMTYYEASVVQICLLLIVRKQVRSHGPCAPDHRVVESPKTAATEQGLPRRWGPPGGMIWRRAAQHIGPTP